MGTDSLAPVTVLLPVHNGGVLLRRAVDSILMQTHSDFELLLIDDGSDDGTSLYADSLTDPRVRVLHQPNRGLVETLNRGLREARHEFVARMDADDEAMPDRLAVQVRHLLRHPSIAAAGSCFVTIDSAGNILDDVHVAADSGYLHRSMYFRNSFAHGSMMFRRQRVLGVGGYRDVGPCEDYDLWVRLMLVSRLGNVPDVLYRYRVSPSQISNRASSQQDCCFRSTRAWLHSEHPLPVVPASTVMREGLRHVEAFPDCRRTAQTYAYDHFGLARMMIKSGRPHAALTLLLGLAMFVVRRPQGVVGLPPLLALATARHRVRQRLRRARQTTE